MASSEERGKISRPHLNKQELAAYIDWELGEADRDRVHRHLCRCEQCFRLYQEVLRAHRTWHVDAEAADSVSPRTNEETPSRPAGPARDAAAQPGRKPFAGRFILRGMLFAVVVIGGFGAYNSLFKSSGWTSDDLSPDIRAVLEAATTTGGMVLPGGERALAKPPVVYRSGSPGVTPGLSAELGRLAEAYGNGEASPDYAYALIGGLVATGQVVSARNYLADARTRYSGDVRFSILDAVVAYADGDLSLSEEILRSVLAADSTDPVIGVALIDLGVVLDEQDRPDEAQRVFSEVQSRFPRSAMARRTEMLIEEIAALERSGRR